MLFKGPWTGKHLHECGQPFLGYVACFLEENCVSFSLQPSAANSSLTERGTAPGHLSHSSGKVNSRS